MKQLNGIKIFFFSFALITLFFAGCKDNNTDPNSGEPKTDKEAFERIADEDSSLASFEDNYNEGDALGFGKTATAIYPFRVGQKVTRTSRTIEHNVIGDTAYATLTKTFTGVLYIAAAYDSASVEPDTILTKAFTSEVKRNLIFVRTGNSDRPYQNWRLAAISLPSGGTTTHSNIEIQSISINLPGGNVVTVTDPLNFYLARGQGWWRQLPIVPKNADVEVTVQLFSTSADTDFVSVTWGGRKQELTKEKRRFTLVSSTPSGTGFLKVYSRTYSTKSNAGFFHAVINAYPRSVIFDDQAAVEGHTWGFPYFVRRD